MAAVTEKLLDEKLTSLEKARAWSPRLISKLESHIRQGGDESLFRINPLTFAGERNLGESETIDLFLYATSLGLFAMDWQLLCPPCSCVVESFRGLAGLHMHYHCNICHADYEAVLDDLIAVAFTVAPAIRDIAFHHPESLSAADYLFIYSGTRDGRLPDGTPFTDAKRSLTKALGYLPPGETTRMEIEIGEGTLLGASVEGRASLLYAVAGPPAAATQNLDVVFGEEVRGPTMGQLSPGRIAFAIDNRSGARGTFVLALLPPGMKPGSAPVTFVPFLSGKRLLSTQCFRDLFRAEVIRASEGIKVRDIALLFTDLKGSTALYDRIGDLNAFSLVQQHFDRLESVAVRHNGAIVKTIGDAVMAVFLSPVDAVRAALAMRGEIASFNRAQPDRPIILKIGVHKGAAIAVTLNDRLDYFGQTVNIASRVQNLADADSILSEEIHAAEGVGAELERLSIEPKTASLKGINQGVKVFRIPPSTSSQ